MCLQPIFKSCAQITSTQNPPIDILCPDKHVGKISDLINNQEFNYKNILNTYEKLIILILESPHKEEFAESEPAPARGETGEKILAHLPHILSQHIDAVEHHNLILMNPVQYQLSLGQRTSMYRDKMFHCVWKHKSFRQDFRNRLKKYINLARKQVIIINACTKNNCRKCLVRLEISTVINLLETQIERENIKYFELPHPSSSAFSQNTSLKKIDLFID